MTSSKNIADNFFRFLIFMIFSSGFYLLFFDNTLSTNESIINSTITFIVSIFLFKFSFKRNVNNEKQKNTRKYKELRPYFLFFLLTGFLFFVSLWILNGFKLYVVVGSGFHELNGYERLITLIPLSLFSFLNWIALETLLEQKNINKKNKQ